MKNFILAAILTTLTCVGIIYAGNSRKQTYASDIGPASASGTALTLVTIGTVPANQQNCLEYASFFSTSATTVYLLDSGTTDYTVTLAASAIHTIPPESDEPWCASKGNALVIQSSAAAATIGVTNRVNYKGFVGQ